VSGSGLTNNDLITFTERGRGARKRPILHEPRAVGVREGGYGKSMRYGEIVVIGSG
jgi:hypothetical protein